jgi:hypothetical protein
MKKVAAQIPKQVEAALDEQAVRSEGWANRLRWWLAITFGVAALWSWQGPSEARSIYLTLAVLWLIAALAVRSRLRQEFSASLVSLTTNVDLTIINLGLLLCWWRGLFTALEPEISFCYFPVLAMTAMRYRIGLVIKAGLYAFIFYTLMASLAAGFPLIRLVMLAAMITVTALVSWKPKSLLINAVTGAAEEAYHLGAQEKEAALASQVQAGILPCANFEAPGLWVIAKQEAGLETSGDYYRVFETNRGPLVVVGDLTGKGIEGVLSAARLDQTLARIIEREAGLTVILGRLNTELWKQYRGARRFTCILARWEGEYLHYVNAGHLPAIRVSKHELSRLPVTSGSVGAAEQATFTEEKIAFPARDLMLIYTDGVCPALAADRDKGVMEMERITGQFNTGEVNTLCYRVFDCAQPAFEKPKDDRTVVVVRRQPAAVEESDHQAQAGAVA